MSDGAKSDLTILQENYSWRSDFQWSSNDGHWLMSLFQEEHEWKSIIWEKENQWRNFPLLGKGKTVTAF